MANYRSRRLTSLWARTVGTTIALMVVLAATTLGLTAYQAAVFERTTATTKMRLDATAALMQSVRDTDRSMTAVLYGVERPGKVEAGLHTFQQLRHEIDVDFARTLSMLPDGRARIQLAQASHGWRVTADHVVAADRRWEPAEVREALARGSDPFAEDWARLKNVQSLLVDVIEETLESSSDARKDLGEQIQRLNLIAIVTALAVAVLIRIWSAFRLRRTVIRPIVALRDTAATMRDGALDTPVPVGNACRELVDLGAALADLASSLHSSHRLLHDQAHSDSLTGLPNRKALIDHLIQRTHLSSREGTGLLFIDLDDFKFVNDTFGHEAGDQLLQVVSARLRSVIGEDDLAARLGGDEFAIALNQGHDVAAAMALAERLISALNTPFQVRDRTLGVGCSIGVAMSGREAMDPQQLLRNADMAMYLAKGGGKNRAEPFSEAGHTEMVARMDLRVALTHAVELDQLQLHYQPVVDLADRAVLGWEALVRWQHPERGLLTPGAFIDLAEETRDIVNIGTWVLDRACQDLARLDPDRSGRWVTVNVSADQLLDEHFAATVEETLQRWRVPPSSLVLEITETTLITDTSKVADTLTTLRERGVRIALDDFGTGFSSLQYLRELPVDIIKIDRSFVNDDTNAGAEGMLEVIVSIARSLDLYLIAEGVEEEAQAKRLVDLGGIAAQGYLFGRPTPIAETTSRPTLRQGLPSEVG